MEKLKKAIITLLSFFIMTGCAVNIQDANTVKKGEIYVREDFPYLPYLYIGYAPTNFNEIGLGFHAADSSLFSLNMKPLFSLNMKQILFRKKDKSGITAFSFVFSCIPEKRSVNYLSLILGGTNPSDNLSSNLSFTRYWSYFNGADIFNAGKIYYSPAYQLGFHLTYKYFFVGVALSVTKNDHMEIPLVFLGLNNPPRDKKH